MFYLDCTLNMILLAGTDFPLFDIHSMALVVISDIAQNERIGNGKVNLLVAIV